MVNKYEVQKRKLRLNVTKTIVLIDVSDKNASYGQYFFDYLDEADKVNSCVVP